MQYMITCAYPNSPEAMAHNKPDGCFVLSVPGHPEVPVTAHKTQDLAQQVAQLAGYTRHLCSM